MLPGLRPGPGRKRRAPSCCTEAGELTRAVTRPDPVPPSPALGWEAGSLDGFWILSEIMSYVHEAAFLSSERAGKVAQAGVGVGGLNHLGPFRVYPGNKRGNAPGGFRAPRLQPPDRWASFRATWPRGAAPHAGVRSSNSCQRTQPRSPLQDVFRAGF